MTQDQVNKEKEANRVDSMVDPLMLANSDYPGMVLTNLPFDGSNFLPWSQQVKRALMAKMKLGFIEGP